MCTPFQEKLITQFSNVYVYYGYETMTGEPLPTKEEYDMVFQRCVEEHRDLLMDMVRDQRDEILKNTDACLLLDYPITDEERARVIEYRQKLRDITKGELPKFSRVDYVLEFDLSEEALLAPVPVDTPAEVAPSVD